MYLAPLRHPVVKHPTDCVDCTYTSYTYRVEQVELQAPALKNKPPENPGRSVRPVEPIQTKNGTENSFLDVCNSCTSSSDISLSGTEESAVPLTGTKNVNNHIPSACAQIDPCAVFKMDYNASMKTFTFTPVFMSNPAESGKKSAVRSFTSNILETPKSIDTSDTARAQIDTSAIFKMDYNASMETYTFTPLFMSNTREFGNNSAVMGVTTVVPETPESNDTGNAISNEQKNIDKVSTRYQQGINKESIRQQQGINKVINKVTIRYQQGIKEVSTRYQQGINKVGDFAGDETSPERSLQPAGSGEIARFVHRPELMPADRETVNATGRENVQSVTVPDRCRLLSRQICDKSADVCGSLRALYKSNLSCMLIFIALGITIGFAGHILCIIRSTHV